MASPRSTMSVAPFVAPAMKRQRCFLSVAGPTQIHEQRSQSEQYPQRCAQLLLPVWRQASTFSALTTKRFTGQYPKKDLPGGEGLSYYRARWYDAQLGRFIQADNIVPSVANPQDWHRYSYVRNSPLKFPDPTGNKPAPARSPIAPIDLTDSWGMQIFFICLFRDCQNVGGRYLAFFKKQDRYATLF